MEVISLRFSSFIWLTDLWETPDTVPAFCVRDYFTFCIHTFDNTSFICIYWVTYSDLWSIYIF